MKKLSITSALMVLCISYAGAQIVTDGSIIGTGAFEFSAGKDKQEFGPGSSAEDKYTSFGLMTWGGYFVTDKLGIGAGINFSLNSQKDDSGDNKFSSTDMSFGPVVRYYIAEGPFVQGYFGFGSSTTKITSGGSELPDQKFKLTEWEGGFGYSVRITDTILLDPMVGYGSSTTTNKDDSDIKLTTSGFFIRIGFTLILVGG
jgi:hypothetical protein